MAPCLPRSPCSGLGRAWTAPSARRKHPLYPGLCSWLQVSLGGLSFPFLSPPRDEVPVFDLEGPQVCKVRCGPPRAQPRPPPHCPCPCQPQSHPRLSQVLSLYQVAPGMGGDTARPASAQLTRARWVRPGGALGGLPCCGGPAPRAGALCSGEHPPSGWLLTPPGTAAPGGTGGRAA